MIGYRREVQVSPRDFWRMAGSGIKGFFSRLLFRRVNPVETRAYAFIRNVFATIAILVLATRAVVALIQAQNKFETRMQSRSCIGVGQIEIQFLVKNNTIYDYYGVPNSRVEVAVETDSGLKRCDQALLAANPELTGTRFQVFTCGVQAGTSSSARRIPTYHITTSSVNGSALLSTDMPRIWLSNRKDSPEASGTLRNGSVVTLVKSAVPLYSPAFELLPGYHLETKAGRMYRRFIKSSMIRDLITMRSDYTQVALFPIITAGSLPLANATMATATIRATLQSGLTYLRSQDAFWSSQSSWEPNFDACDFIEDYRASTVFDVLGSVGGLFAILEAIHLLLFGRPMLWGIFGTKLISPFGLTGVFSSDTFKRRLREQYHREPTDDNPDTIRVGAFLQDFVIDFGPANPQPKQQILHPLPMLRKRGHVPNRQETINSQTSLTYTEPPSPSESDRGFDSHKHPFASVNQ